MPLKIDLAEESPRGMTFTLEDGGEVRFTFERRLDRQSRQTYTKEVGRGKDKKEVLDYDRLFKLIGSIEGDIVDGNGEPYGRITDKAMIVEIMKVIPEDIAVPVSEHLLGHNTVGAEQKN